MMVDDDRQLRRFLPEAARTEGAVVLVVIDVDMAWRPPELRDRWPQGPCRSTRPTPCTLARAASRGQGAALPRRDGLRAQIAGLADRDARGPTPTRQHCGGEGALARCRCASGAQRCRRGARGRWRRCSTAGGRAARWTAGDGGDGGDGGVELRRGRSSRRARVLARARALLRAPGGAGAGAGLVTCLTAAATSRRAHRGGETPAAHLPRGSRCSTGARASADAPARSAGRGARAGRPGGCSAPREGQPGEHFASTAWCAATARNERADVAEGTQVLVSPASTGRARPWRAAPSHRKALVLLDVARAAPSREFRRRQFAATPTLRHEQAAPNALPVDAPAPALRLKTGVKAGGRSFGTTWARIRDVARARRPRGEPQGRSSDSGTGRPPLPAGGWSRPWRDRATRTRRAARARLPAGLGRARA